MSARSALRTCRAICQRITDSMWRYRRRPDLLVKGAVLTVRRKLGLGGPGTTQRRARQLARARRHHDRVARHRLHRFLQLQQRLVVPSAADPEVSVVLVIYRRADLALACLRSIVTVTVPAEVVVVDNASPDETGALLAQLDGAIVARNEENIGFLRAAQQGAGLAKGRTLLFVNSDVEIKPGSIEAALRAMAETGAGAVGGRLVLPDGSLQEAGAVVWSDGSTAGIGRYGDPNAAEFQFRRPVDYCSGAFLLVGREAWDAVGGFDDRFAPAYYEDVDLCMRLWEAGWPVMFEPDVLVEHYEFGSSSSDLAVALMQRNRALFAPRHRAALAKVPAPNSESHPHLRRCGPPRVLVIEDRVPHVDLGSGFPRSLRIIEAMVGLGWFVTLYPRHPVDEAATAYRTLPKVVEVMLGWDIAYLRRFLEARRGCYDVLFVCRSHNLADVRAVLAGEPGLLGGARLVYDAEAVTAVREIAAADVVGEPIEAFVARAMIDAELRLAREADAVVAVSEREAQSFRDAIGDVPVLVLSHAVYAEPGRTPFADRRHLLFAGPLLTEHTPNTDSVTWFAREVLPRLQAELGPLAPRLVVVGRLGEFAQALHLEGVDLVGPVEDLRPFYESSRLLVAPTRFAAGVPIKVLEAAAQGLPVVATDLLAAQLGWADGREMRAVPASDPVAFADACMEMYLDEVRWEETRAAALARVKAQCAPDQFRSAMARLLNGIATTVAAPPDVVQPGP